MNSTGGPGGHSGIAIASALARSKARDFGFGRGLAFGGLQALAAAPRAIRLDLRDEAEVAGAGDKARVRGSMERFTRSRTSRNERGIDDIS